MADNPNNCQRCDHKQHAPEDGWCYMFRYAPTAPCAQHTARFESARAFRLLMAGRILDAMKEQQHG